MGKTVDKIHDAIDKVYSENKIENFWITLSFVYYNDLKPNSKEASVIWW